MTRLATLAVCLATIFAFGNAPANAGAQAGVTPDSSPPREIVMRAPVEVPLITNPASRVPLPVIEVTINGKGPFRFGIETGARFVGVSRGFADSLGLRRVGGPDQLPQFVADSIDVGAASFRGVPVATLPAAARGVDGILGLPFYQGLLLTIDYPARIARLERGSLPKPNGHDVLRLQRAGDFWSLPVSIGSRALDAVLDTRSTGTFSITPAVASTLKFDGGLEVIGRAGGAAIPVTEVRGGRLAGDVTIGQYTFPHPLITVRELPPGFPAGPLVGSSILQYFAVTLDQRNGRLRLARAGPPEIELPNPQAARSPP
jgi:hypothetical protein